jgi:phage gp46-like protein
MIQDILIQLDQDLQLYDLVLNEDGTDFKSSEGFDTAIPVSLFTDKRAPSSLVPEASRRRGWVGNILTLDEEFELGSLLWILDQAKLTQTEIISSQIYAKDCLSWLINIGAAESITVVTTQTATRGILINIKIRDNNNNLNQYQTLWRSTNAS